MPNAGLDEAKAVIKIARRNINNLRYADNTTFMAENKEELKSHLMEVKEESEKPVCIKKEKLEPDMKQWTGSKWGKEYDKAVYCHPAYLTYLQSTSCKMLGWMKSRLPGEISITSDMQMTPPLWQKVKRNSKAS